jgi:hypothetical protein
MGGGKLSRIRCSNDGNKIQQTFREAALLHNLNMVMFCPVSDLICDSRMEHIAYPEIENGRGLSPIH